MICGFGPEPSRVVVQFQVQFCLDFPCLLPEIVVVSVNKFWVVFSCVVFCSWWIVKCGGSSYVDAPLFDLCFAIIVVPRDQDFRQDLPSGSSKHFKPWA